MSKDGERIGVYNLYNKENGLITFVPTAWGTASPTSYQLPAFLDKWAQVASQTVPSGSVRRRSTSASHRLGTPGDGAVP